MNDRRLDQLVRRAQSHTQAVAGSSGLGRGAEELLREIMSTPAMPQFESPETENLPTATEPTQPLAESPVELFPTAPALPHRRRRGVLIGVAAAAAFALAVAGPTLAFHRGDRATVVPGGQPAQATTIPSGNPRALIDDKAWRITNVEENSPNTGEIDFRDGPRTVSVNWYPATRYGFYYKDRLEVSAPEPIVVLGHKSVLFTYDATDFAAMLPPENKNTSFVEIRGIGGDKAAFEALLGEVKTVSARAWLAAMPPSVITPAESKKTIKQMLADIPLPPGFDVAKLPTWGRTTTTSTARP